MPGTRLVLGPREARPRGPGMTVRGSSSNGSGLTATPSPPADHRLYGRRRGRPLRAGRRLLRDARLPQLAIELAKSGALDPASLFATPVAAVWLEIGFGGGEHLAEQAERHPDVGFIGCEVFDNGIARLVGEIARGDLANIRIFADDARLLLDRLEPGSIARVFVLFPDPWPKERHHKRRLVASATLDRLAAVMRPGTELRLATDDRFYLAWMLEHLTAHPDFVWAARRPQDWRERPADWPPTRYEAKARTAGRTPVFLRFLRR
jgi:tRNA (guanine-N7-)-methyltransferase